jgi:hypothetical protein
MSSPAGKVLVIVGTGVALASTFLDYYTNFTFWQEFKRWDVITAIMCAAAITLAIIALTQPSARTSIAVALLGFGVLVNFVPFVVEGGSFLKAGAYVGGLGGLVAGVGAVMVAVGDLQLRPGLAMGGLAPPQVAMVGGLPAIPSATQPPPPVMAPVATPAGWYGDPHVPGQQRYWDGGTWTEHTHGGMPSG